MDNITLPFFRKMIRAIGDHDRPTETAYRYELVEFWPSGTFRKVLNLSITKTQMRMTDENRHFEEQVTGDWKLIEYFEDGRSELYNLKDDIGEKQNVASEHPDKVQALHDKIVAWRKSVGAKMPTKNVEQTSAKQLTPNERRKARRAQRAASDDE